MSEDLKKYLLITLVGAVLAGAWSTWRDVQVLKEQGLYYHGTWPPIGVGR